MGLTETDVALVRATWARVAPVAPMMSKLFYARLFKIAPETQPLFARDMAAQGQKLTNTLGFIVDHLDRPDALLADARALAIRHVDYSVRAEHYRPVGEALLFALRELIGPGFGAAERAAWTKAYDGLVAEMLDAAYPLKPHAARA